MNEYKVLSYTAFISSLLALILGFLPLDLFIIIINVVAGVVGVITSIILLIKVKTEGRNTLIIAGIGLAAGVFWLISFFLRQ